MKILHIISQHPESTGSGIYVQNVIRQAGYAGHENFLIAGISGNKFPALDCIEASSCRFVGFGHGRLAYPIPGMSDIMPYPSSIFATLSASQIDAYELEFAKVIEDTVDAFKPDIIHSHHLWLVSAVTRRRLPDIPMVTSCHSTDLRQYLLCPHLRDRVLPHCQQIDRPAPEDLPVIEHRLRKALDSMTARVLASPSSDPEKIEKITAEFAWSAVFKKIMTAYKKVLSS